jgi:hypothetical protein
MSDPREPDEITSVEPEGGEERQDGSTVIKIDGEPDDGPPPGQSPFYENLALKFPEQILDSISLDLTHKIEVDRESRRKRDEQYEEGMRRSGLGKDAPGGADFEGASKAVHPMITEACIDFAARVMKELWPADGIVKDKVVGKATPEKLDRAKRKVAHMNYQLTEEIPEARGALEQCLSQVPLGGSQYIKAYFNRRLKRQSFEVVYVDDVFLPFLANGGLKAAERKTHRQYLTELTIQERVAGKDYRDIKLVAPSSGPDERSKTDKAADKVEGKDEPSENTQGTREVYETSFSMKIDGQVKPHLDREEVGEVYPYIISIDKLTGKVFSLYRNWDEEDEIREDLTCLVEFGFVPWRGAYCIGLPHIIGGLSAAATGALRGLLDSAHVNNTLTLLKLESQVGMQGQQANPRPTEVSTIKAPLGTTDIRMAAMPVPFNPPAPVLFQLLQFIVQEAKGVVRTSLDETPADQNPGNMPVGTQLSRVEQGLVVYSYIFSKSHASLHELLRVMHRNNRLNMPDDVTVSAKDADVLVYRADYEGPMDVIPVSDPRIFSEQQRFAQTTAVVSRSQNNPMYNQRKVEERFLEGLKIPNWEELLIPVPEPQRMNAVAENVAMALGRPALAFPDQEHLAHIQVHLDFLTSLGLMPLMAGTVIKAMLEHLKEHVAYWYLNDFYNVVSKAADTELSNLLSADPQEQKQIDELLAHASPIVLQDTQKAFVSLPAIIQRAMSVMQQMSPPGPMDPGQASIQTATIGAQVQREGIQSREKAEAAKLQQREQQDQNKDQLERDRLEQQAGESEAKLATQTAIATDKTQTAKEVAAVDVAVEGRKADLTDGGGIR